MPLSPQDVRNKLFTPVRFKPGYDEDEVDAFLDEVEAELTRLHGLIEQGTGDAGAGPGAGSDATTAASFDEQLVAVRAEADERLHAALEEADQRSGAQLAAVRAAADAELEELRAGAGSASFGGSDPSADLAAQVDAAVAAELEARVAGVRREAEARIAQLTAQAQQAQGQLQQAAAAVAQAQQQAAAAQQEADAAHAELARLQAAPGASEAPLPFSPSEETLRRTLILAQRTADEAIAEARAEAEATVTAAQTEAEQTAQAAAAAHAALTAQREMEHREAINRGRVEHELLVSKLEELRSFERDYRSRLRAYLHLQLRDLESGAPEPSSAVAGRSATAIEGSPTGDLQPHPGPEPHDAHEPYAETDEVDAEAGEAGEAEEPDVPGLQDGDTDDPNVTDWAQERATASPESSFYAPREPVDAIQPSSPDGDR